ncbi:heme-degrading monooxygenase HmoA [Amycolatopsis echigonensis]|uniref:Heme-degrading monooxygenase HmoA n=1 Tax=Amycolatopsis echigonensis TaxID=2576905 RepID=A0A2N3WJB2_9PSEU|nr:antibiotic biosynthesis monooxygenase [Amycolatopsis niigatensis]PKV93964.1 heme-degrading monooxygenase HmoA [Amycolatopsis niigatensis]
MTGEVKVLVYASDGGAETGAVSTAYHEVSLSLAATPGLLRNQLLRSVHDRDRFVVMSEWADLTAFTSWEEGAAHRDVTAPLRPLQDGADRGVFGIYEVVAEYRAGTS